MPLNSVQQHVKGLLTDLAMTSYPQKPLQTFIAPPVPDQMSSPRCYVWGAHFIDDRQTAPRGNAFMEAKYDMDLWVFTVEDPNSAGIDQRFPVLVDQIKRVLLSSPMPISLTDPTTGEISQLVSIGEHFETRYDTERALADQRYVRLLALITAHIEEVYVG